MKGTCILLIVSKHASLPCKIGASRIYAHYRYLLYTRALGHAVRGMSTECLWIRMRLDHDRDRVARRARFDIPMINTTLGSIGPNRRRTSRKGRRAREARSHLYCGYLYPGKQICW